MKLMLAAVLLATAPIASAVDADFYLVGKECRVLIVGTESGQFAQNSGDVPNFACDRRGSSMSCLAAYPSGGKPGGGVEESYRVVLDSPPHMLLIATNGASTFMINSQSRVAVSTARMADLKYLGEKVCSLQMLTAQEVEMLGNTGVK